jgi:hypothetical protein
MDEKAHLKEEPEDLTALPWKQVIPLVILQLCESFNNSSIFSYVPFLVQDFSNLDRDTAGRWAGLVSSAVYLVGSLYLYLYTWVPFVLLTCGAS